MAKFKMELPVDEIKQMQKLAKDMDKICGAMTQAGAEVVKKYMEINAPAPLRGHMKTSVTYTTPTDGAINTKVYVSGYIPFSNPNRSYFSRSGGSGRVYHTTKGVPAEFLANLYEYGRSTAPFPKHPFMRKSIKKSEIEAAMLEAQKYASGGILDE